MAYVSVILAHPRHGSFNHAIAATALQTLEAQGLEARFHDLYLENFDPILLTPELDREPYLHPELEQHCREIAAAQGIVIVHPNWWGQPPAILKGWIDRVLRPEVAYRFREGDTGEGVPVGLLQAKAAIVFTTSNTPRERELAVFGDPLETLWGNCIFGLCGVPRVIRKNFAVVVTSTAAQRQAWLDEVRETLCLFTPA
ncbi:MAG: NAD(P)H-dependent oxidoreductase [Syntrophobacterales bacterium]|jgi:putative NADPH-quinone reductase|nr:NAD(P)H-dependent oxidoreductase [Syntrophobacterales bacterium]